MTPGRYKNEHMLKILSNSFDEGTRQILKLGRRDFKEQRVCLHGYEVSEGREPSWSR